MSLSLVNTISLAWAIVAIVLVPIQLKVTAPYGRHSKSGWGPMISNKLGWILMESPSMLIMAYFLYRVIAGEGNINSIFMMGLWVLHYLNRSVIFPLRTRTDGKQMPLSIAFSAIFFNLVNAPLNGYYFLYFADYPELYGLSWNFLTGFFLFFLGVYINNKSDTMLINLRQPGQTGYVIPKGFLFKYISCPNLFGEMVEWLGFALMAWHWPGWTFFIWTICNLLPRAVSHHKWYLEKFPDYPKERKAVVPFLV
jgi:3-oxo-5-alpha-steroid 4-dehydrogenase 1